MLQDDDVGVEGGGIFNRELYPGVIKMEKSTVPHSLNTLWKDGRHCASPIGHTLVGLARGDAGTLSDPLDDINMGSLTRRRHYPRLVAAWEDGSLDRMAR